MTTDSDQIALDAELVARARLGDSFAMHDLLSSLRPAVLRYCRFRLASYAGGFDAAEDAAQETCLAVSRVLGNYQDQGPPFRAWVYAIAANKVADSRRRSGRGPVLVDEVPEQVEPSLTPEELAIASMEYTATLNLIERLPDRMRQVLLLRAGGAPAKKVAEELGMTPGAVNVAHHRAVARLRQWACESAEYRALFAVFRDRNDSPTCGQAA